MNTSYTTVACPNGKKMARPRIVPVVRATVLLGTILFLAAGLAKADISGVVFADGNNNGIKDTADQGVQGVMVRAYDTSGALSASAVTNNSGAYTLGIAGGGTFRLEFENIGSYFPAAIGSSSASAVQFVGNGSTTANYGMYVPGQVILDLNPRYVASCDASAGAISVGSWLNNQTYPVGTQSPILHPHNDDLTSSQVGVPFSFAQKPGTKLLVMTPMASPMTSQFPSGPQGASALYIADFSGVNSAYLSHKLLVRLDAIGVDVSAQYPIGTIQPRFGEYGLAGAEYSADGNFLYVINMGSGKLLKINVSGVDYAQLPATAPTATDVSEITIPASVHQSLGRFRPTTTTLNGADLYVGGVDDLTGELKVLKMDTATDSFTMAFATPVNFKAGLDINGGGQFQGGWLGGPDNSTAGVGIMQPFLTDVVFDDTGSMILGVTNRMVYNLNSNSQPGYVIRTWREADGTYTRENNKISGPFTSTAINTNLPTDGPGGNFFFQNGVPYSNYSNPIHTYLFSGGLMNIPGNKEIVGGYIDPVTINQFGARYLDWTNGRVTRGIGLGGAKTFSIVGTSAVKAPGPIEIGNRVWNDSNGNGRQDPGEAPIAGVSVELWTSGGTLLDTAVTDTDGVYVFSSDTLRSPTNSHRYQIAGLLWQEDYFVKIPDASGGGQQAPLAGLSLTLTNAAGDQRDSDGTASGTDAQVAVTTGTIGENAHDYDFGFTGAAAAPACEVIDAIVTAQSCDNNGTPTDPSDDFYLADVEVSFLNAPSSGTLDLSGPALHTSNTVSSVVVASLASSTSHTFNGVRLKANNAASTLTASFSAEPGCAYNFATPKIQACSNPPCAITAINAPVGVCSTNNTAGIGSDDYYLSNIVVTFSGAPLSGYLALGGDALAPLNTVTVVPVSYLDSATSHTFYNVRLKADGSPRTLSATFTVDTNCTLSVPLAAVPACSGITSVDVTPGPCNDNGTPTSGADDYYVSDVVINYAVKPGSGNLTLTGVALHSSNPSFSIAVGSIGATSHTFTNVKFKANGLANALAATFTIDSAHPFNLQAPAVDDCEVIPEVAVGNLVFVDKNENGFFDAGDTGLDDVEVQLWSSTNATLGDGDDVRVQAGTDGDPSTSGDNADPTLTNGGGCYLFKKLPVGNYYVLIPASQFGAGNALQGYIVTTPAVAGKTVDDTTDQNGVAGTGGNIVSNVFALADNGEPTAESGKDAANAVNAADDNNTNLTIDFGFKCEPIILTTTPAVLAEGTIGAAYNAAINASGGKAPYNFAVTSGALPAGLNLNSTTGSISGTPTGPVAINSFSVTVTDDHGCTKTASFDIGIGCVPLVLTPSSLPNAVIGQPYGPVAVQVSGNTGATTFTLTGTLPAGMTFNTTTGVFAGTPTAGGSQNLTVQARDSVDCVGTVNLSILSACPSITVSPNSLPNGMVGVPYLQSISASGGNTPYTYALSTGPLPAGLTLNTSTGEISGTPTAPENRNFLIGVTDFYGCTTGKNLSITIACNTLSVTPSALPAITAGFPFDQQMSVSGNTGSVSWSISAGQLPTGVTLNSSGLLSGTSTQSGAYSFTVRAMDQNGCEGSVALAGNILCPAINLQTPLPLPVARIGVPYNVQLSVTGVPTPHVYALTSGSLPDGITLSGSGLISGTPTQSESTNISFSVNGLTTCDVVPPVIVLQSCPIITINPASLPDGMVGAAYHQVITSTGGRAPVTYTLTAGTLPAGAFIGWHDWGPFRYA